MANNVIREKSFKFALDIIRLYCKLRDSQEYVISKQLLRSGTSIGANVEEAISAQSTKDFLSKMSIATKEARETRYWLLLLKESEITDIEVSIELDAVSELLKILISIVKTTQEKLDGECRRKHIQNS